MLLKLRIITKKLQPIQRSPASVRVKDTSNTEVNSKRYIEQSSNSEMVFNYETIPSNPRSEVFVTVNN